VYVCVCVCLLCVGSLQIKHSLETDEGKYECVAENSVGVAYSYGANLYVRGKARGCRTLKKENTYYFQFYIS